MTVEWYRENGYEVSANMSQAVIDKAEDIVMDTYVRPVVPAATKERDDIQKILACITFYYLCLENVKVTRKGAKEKLDENSTRAVPAEYRIEGAAAYEAFHKLPELEGANRQFDVHDILYLWGLSPFFGA